MNTETYNPVLPLTALDNLSDIYWSNCVAAQVSGIGFLFGAAMAAALVASI
ncbi:hypothetical protein D3C72_2544390 [compost metagenome]